MPTPARRPHGAVQPSENRDAPGLLTRAASFVPATWSESDRTIDVVWTTGADVERYDWLSDARYIERLSLEPGAVRLDRLNAGASVLDTHGSWSLRSVIGAVVPGSASIEGGQGRAKIRLSANPDHAGVVADIASGVIRHISVGYAVHREDRQRLDTGIEVRTATDWEPHEISFVPVPADAGAQSRGAPRPGATMPRQTPKPAPRSQTRAASLDALVAAVDAKVSDEMPRETIVAELASAAGLEASAVEQILAGEVECTDEQLAAFAGVLEVPVEGLAATESGEQSADDAARAAPTPAAKRTASQERERATGILTTLRALDLPVERAEELIASDSTLDEVRKMLINERAAAAAKTAVRSQSNVSHGRSHKEQAREGMANAIQHRANPRAVKLTDAGRSFVHKRMVDLARECLQAEGVDCASWPAHRVFSYAMRAQSTSDFPLILADVTQKSLLAAWPETPPAYEAFCAQASASDLRTRYPTLFSGAATLGTVAEGADYPINTLTESRESYAVVKKGQILQITLEALINDDLGAFNRAPRALVNAAIRARNAAVFGLINANAAMADGTALFHADHNNLVGAGAAPSAATFDDTGKLIRKQTGLKGEKLDLMPAIIVAPAALEHTIEQLFSPNYLPTQASGVLAGYQSGMRRVYSPFLDDTSATAFYMFADPAESPVIEYALLSGQEGLSVQEEEGFDNDCKKFKIRDFFGAGVVDHRGAAKNPGA